MKPRDLSGAPTVRLGRFRALLDVPAFVRAPDAHLARLTQEAGDCFLYPFGGLRPTLVVSRPSIVHHVLKTGEAAFAKSDIQARQMQRFIGPGLLTFEGEAWRRQRRVIAAGLQARALEPLTRSLAQAVEARLDRMDAALEGEIDIDAQIRPLAFAMVAQAMIGPVITDAEIHTISDAITRVQAHLVRCIVLPGATAAARMTGVEQHYQRLRRRGDAIVARHVEARMLRGEAPRDARPDMLDLLIGAKHPEHGRAMAREDVLAEIMQLLVAGHETSSIVLGWALWLLAAHPDALARAREETDAVLGGRPPGLADLPQLSWCMAVLKETMRLYPPFWLIDRIAIADSEVDGVRIAKGQRITLFVQGVHRRADLWHSPDAFLPGRFLGEERRHERDGGYIPFGSGPRTCVGSNFAVLQMLLILAAVLRRYDIAPGSRPPRPRAQLTLRAGDGIRLHLRKHS